MFAFSFSAQVTGEESWNIEDGMDADFVKLLMYLQILWLAGDKIVLVAWNFETVLITLAYRDCDQLGIIALVPECLKTFNMMPYIWYLSSDTFNILFQWLLCETYNNLYGLTQQIKCLQTCSRVWNQNCEENYKGLQSHLLGKLNTFFGCNILYTIA